MLQKYPKTKNAFFPYLWVLHFCMFSTYGVALSFFPSISKAHELSPVATGIIFSVYPLGGLIIGVIIPNITRKYAKRNILYFFFSLLSFFIILFGLNNYIENKTYFFFVAVLSRFGQVKNINI
jgi:predicted MFS family arabinose efflux permease